MNQRCLPEGSICEGCIHCMIRIIEPLDYEAFGLDEEDEISSIIVQALCLLSDVDLHDHIVKECSEFEHKTLMKNIFLK